MDIKTILQKNLQKFNGDIKGKQKIVAIVIFIIAFFLFFKIGSFLGEKFFTMLFSR